LPDASGAVWYEPLTVMIIKDATFVAGASTLESLPPPLFVEMAFAGRSNVGKSSLLNAIMARKSLVRTSRTPGLTRQLNFFRVVAQPPKPSEPFTVDLVDLPGYGFAKISKGAHRAWGPLMDGYLGERPTLRAVAIIVDVRRGLEEDDLQLLSFLHPERPKTSRKALTVFLLATKLDKISKSDRKIALQAVKVGAKRAGVTGSIIGVSAVNGEGIEHLWSQIQEVML
jgi:GTP-binding protein